MAPKKAPVTPEPIVFTEEDLRHHTFRWYAIQSQSGMEKRAKINLEDRIKRLKLEDFFGKILIPMMLVDKVDASGKKSKVERKMMPGYIFVQMDPNNKATFLCVKDTPHISAFIGTQTQHDEPPPVPDEEISRVFNRATEAAKQEQIFAKVQFEKGEKVKVIDGPFTNFVGDIDEVKQDKMKLRLLITVFGRATPVEIEFSKVQKVEG